MGPNAHPSTSTSSATSLACATPDTDVPSSLSNSLTDDSSAPPNSGEPAASSSAGAGKAKKKLGRPTNWTSETRDKILSTENTTRYAINRSIDGHNPKSKCQGKLIDKVTAALGESCNWDEDNILEAKKNERKPFVIKDLGLMTGEARAKEIQRRLAFISEHRQVRRFASV
jgi:hypothetical protein